MSHIPEIEVREEILPIIVGKLFNKDVIVDLFRLPHLLICGAPEQGKTVCLNSIITSLLCKKQSSELKFVFIDPKGYELTQYNKLNKTYIAQLGDEEDAVITDCDIAKRTLESLNEEKNNRYELLKKANARSIVEYNGKFAKGLISPIEGHSTMPYIVIAIDEFADLMFNEEIEHQLHKIAILGHPVGIHLVLTTQRPSDGVIPYRLKVHFPARIAFRMYNVEDSIRVMDCDGAVYLKSCGDLLFSYSNSVNHLKGAFIDSHEIEPIIESINNHRSDSNPYILPFIDEDNRYS